MEVEVTSVGAVSGRQGLGEIAGALGEVEPGGGVERRGNGGHGRGAGARELRGMCAVARARDGDARVAEAIDSVVVRAAAKDGRARDTIPAAKLPWARASADVVRRVHVAHARGGAGAIAVELRGLRTISGASRETGGGIGRSVGERGLGAAKTAARLRARSASDGGADDDNGVKEAPRPSHRSRRIR
jgi:hypothetical protein